MWKSPVFTNPDTRFHLCLDQRGPKGAYCSPCLRAYSRPLSSLKSLVEHLKPVAPLKKAKEIDCTTSARQKHEFPHLVSSTNADGRSIYADDSMLGQPPSVCAASPLVMDFDHDPDSEDFEMDMERSLDMALRHVYHEVQEEGIEGCVLEERLDEKDVALMDGAEYLFKSTKFLCSLHRQCHTFPLLQRTPTHLSNLEP